jgi:hypothetical protein
MKIYNEIAINMNPESPDFERVMYEDSYEYFGGLALAGKEDRTISEGVLQTTISDEKLLNPFYDDLTTTEFIGSPEYVKTMNEIYESGVEFWKDAMNVDPINPLPSLPSISNVGVMNPTGVINWSSVPGGFQPLPQVSGGKKKLYQLSQFHGGINQRTHPRDLSDNECQEAENVAFSEVGQIKVLGSCLYDDNDITFPAPSLDPEANIPGYGLFQFSAPADPDDDQKGDVTITLTADKDQTMYYSDYGSDQDSGTGFADMGGNEATNIAQIYYAAGNGVYITDSTLSNADNNTTAKIYVYREDAAATPGAQTVSGWKQGKPLINAPTYDAAAAASMAAGDVKVVHAAETASEAGTMIVDCTPNGTLGTWDGTYYFYVSWLFDGGTETGLTSCGSDGGVDNVADGILFTTSTSALDLNISLKHTPHASANTELGGDKRIEGGRIYFKEVNETERHLLAEFNLVDGVKDALSGSFRPWVELNDVYRHTTITFYHPPKLHTFFDKNGYYANETYTPSKDISDNEDAGPTALTVRYKTVTVGSQGTIYIGNVVFDGKHKPDAMMYSARQPLTGNNWPGAFPKYNIFDSPSSDGSPITALASFQDTILQFKSSSLCVINVSNPGTYYAEQIYRDCGVFNPCQVFTCSFGIIFVNKHGCFVYDGDKVVSLTSGKFDWISTSGITEHYSDTADAPVPCIGYDPRSQSIVILKNIGDNSQETGAWIYHMPTQSWSEATQFIINANVNRHTNFIITAAGYLSIKRSGDASGTLDYELFNFNHHSEGSRPIDYITKDIDFGFPSQTKKIFKIYVTYSPSGAVPTLYYGVNGDTDPTETFEVIDDGGGGSGGFATSGSTHLTATFSVNDTALTGIYSLQLRIEGTAQQTFVVNDISILYRLRPIK